MKKAPFLFASIVLGFVAGGVGGGLTGYVLSLDDSTVVPAITGGVDASVVEESDTVTVAETATKAVVSIEISKTVTPAAQSFNFGGPFSDFFQTVPGQQPTDNSDTAEPVEVGEGSGFIVTADGMIVTNRHVVSDEDATYAVVLSDGTRYVATVLARDIVTDVAIIKIDGIDLPFLTLGDSDTLRRGQTVLAIGNTLGEYDNTVTKGIVSGLSRDLGGEYTGLIQTDASISQGNSGGPLVNVAGQVIGVNTLVDRAGEGLGFAVPINDVKIVVDSVQQNGRIIRAGLGVRYIPIDETFASKNNLDFDYGAYVRGDDEYVGVLPGSSAATAGVKEGDIILEVDGTKVDTEHTLSTLIRSKAIGEVVKLTIYRDGAQLSLDATLTELPQEGE